MLLTKSPAKIRILIRYGIGLLKRHLYRITPPFQGFKLSFHGFSEVCRGRPGSYQDIRGLLRLNSLTHGKIHAVSRGRTYQSRTPHMHV